MRCDGSKCCRGCGPQEQFYGCADVAISAGSGVNAQPPKFTLPPYIGNFLTTKRWSGSGAGIVAPNSFVPLVNNNLPSGPVALPQAEPKCRATKEFSNPVWDEWCMNTCHSGDDCPKNICTDDCREDKPVCRAKEFYRAKQANPVVADQWCAERCSTGLCPFEYCEESCWSST